MTFTERTPIEAGFAAIFEREIAPELGTLETRRQEALARSRKRFWLALGVAALIGGAVAVMAQSLVPLFVFGVIGFVVGVILSAVAQSGYRGAVAELVMPKLCDFLGDMSYAARDKSEFPVGAVRGLGLVGSYSSARLTHLVTGRWWDTGFQMVQARLTKKSGSSGSSSSTSSRTIFEGLLFSIAVPVPAPTRILIARDYGETLNKLANVLSLGGGRSMPRVAFDHPEFEAAFEVHADDPEAARSFMPPAFLGTLVDIGEAEGGKAGARAMTAGFEGDRFYLALARDRGFLEIGKLHDSLDGIEERLHAAFADITIIRRIIDRLHGVTPET